MDNGTDVTWTEVDELLDAALDRPADERAAFLNRACAGRPDLRREVKALLEADGEALSFLRGEAVAFAAPAYDPDEKSIIDADPLAVPSRHIGGYRLTEEIGRGGMSRVFRAERIDGQIEQTVAVKLLRIGLDTDEARRRFRIEQQVLATLQHPNIAQFFDGGVTEDDVPYLVMEYVEGQPITAFCDAHRLSIDDRLQLLHRVGEALQHAHRNLVVHRDLKPSNVLVTPEGTVKLLDFGIAKLLDEAEAAVTVPVTRTGMRPMTPAYAAPEQVEEGTISTATDVYQLGILAYEVLTGHRPFEECSRFDIEEAVRDKVPDRPSSIVGTERPDVDEEGQRPVTPAGISKARNTTPRQLRHTLEGDLDTIILTALRKEADRRYPSINGLLDDLQRYEVGQPVEARAHTLGYRTQKFVLRHRWGLGIATAFLVVIGIFATMLVQQRDRARQEAQKAETVSAYLVELFDAGDPYNPPDTLSAQTIVRRGMERVERLQDRPVVQAEMLDALGQASRGLGDWARADSLLQRALTLRRRHLDAPHSELVASLLHVADAKWNGQRFWEARPLYEEALSMSEQLGETKHRADILEGIAQTMAVQGAPDSAEVLMRTSIDLQRRQQALAYHELPLDQMRLARIVQQQGRHDRAEDLYRAALQRMENEPGYTQVERARAYSDFGALLRNKGEHAAAGTYYRKALSLSNRVLGRTHPRSHQARDHLYEILLMQGKYEDALSLARRGLELAENQAETSRYPITTAYQRVGHLLDNMGRSAEALSLLQTATQMRREERGADHLWTHSTGLRYALCLLDADRTEDARGLLRAAEEALQHTHSDSTTLDLTRMKALLAVGNGMLHAEEERWEVAASYLSRGFALRRDQMGLRAPLSQRALRHLVEVYERAGQSARAAMYRDSLLMQ